MQVDQDLVLFWTLDGSTPHVGDVGGLTIADTSGTLASVAGKVGNCLSLAIGDTEYGLTAHDPLFSMAGDSTFQVWAQLSSKPGTDMYVLSKWGADGNRSYRVYWATGTDRWIFTVSNNGGTSVSVTANNAGAPNIGEWYLITVRHFLGNGISIQINDGVPNFTSHLTGIFENTASFALGALFTTSASSYFDGLLDQPCKFDRALRQIDVRFIYNSGNGRTLAELATDIPEPIKTKAIGTATHSAQSGTINALAKGVTAIVGTGTAFTTEFTTSNRLIVQRASTGEFVSYDITAIADDTHLTLAGGLAEATAGTEVPYKEGSSRDYSTVQLWEADLSNGSVYEDGDIAIGEGYNDSEFSCGVGGFPVIDGGASIGGTSGRNLLYWDLTVASGERHDGTAGTGARMVVNAINDTVDGATIEFRRTVVMSSRFTYWEINGNDYQTNETIKDQTNTGNCTFTIAWNILHGVLITQNGPRHFGMQIKGGSANSQFYIHNNILYNYSHTGTGGGGRLSGIQCLENKQFVFNNTIHDFSGSSDSEITGINAKLSDGGAYVDASTDECRNNICTDITSVSGTVACFYLNATTVSNNISTDATATGTGSLTGIDGVDLFVNVGSGMEDLHLKTGADAVNAGTDLGTTYGAQIDINGRDRDAEGDTWDIGAHEFVFTGNRRRRFICGAH